MHKENDQDTRVDTPGSPVDSLTAANSGVLTPPLKWAGGKRWQVPHIKPLWEASRATRLVEPFCGGLSIALTVRNRFLPPQETRPHDRESARSDEKCHISLMATAARKRFCGALMGPIGRFIDNMRSWRLLDAFSGILRQRLDVLKAIRTKTIVNKLTEAQQAWVNRSILIRPQSVTAAGSWWTEACMSNFSSVPNNKINDIARAVLREILSERERHGARNPRFSAPTGPGHWSQ